VYLVGGFYFSVSQVFCAVKGNCELFFNHHVSTRIVTNSANSVVLLKYLCNLS